MKSNNTHGGARPKTRQDDARGGARQGAGRKRQTWLVTTQLNGNKFIFPVGRKNEAEAIKAFAERIGYEVEIKKENEMETYVNYNRHGQNVGHNSIKPYNINVDGVEVSFDGQMSKKVFDTINQKNLVSHSIGTTLYANTEADAQEVATLLEQNPNYSRA